jgi:hypothetical protein
MFVYGKTAKKSSYRILVLTKLQFIDLLFKKTEKNKLLKNNAIVFKSLIGLLFCDSTEA